MKCICALQVIFRPVDCSKIFVPDFSATGFCSLNYILQTSMDSQCERSISKMTVGESKNAGEVDSLQQQAGSTNAAEIRSVNPADLEQSGTGPTCVKLKLYSYWRSSCSWRVRIALNLKGLQYEYEAVNLLEGKQFSDDYTKLNPLQVVPTLVDGDIIISDSLAILLYLEDKYPEHPLLPVDLRLKAINFQVAGIVGSSIQPFQNMAVLKVIEAKLGPAERLGWAQHFIEKGLAALEKLLEGIAGKYCIGDQVSLADVYLVPQFASAARFSVNTSQFPTLKRINQALEELPEFQAAVPARQPDAKYNVN